MSKYGPRPRSLDERFWEKVSPEPNSGCWLWVAGRNTSGYGTIKCRPGGTRSATRISWELAFGSTPSGLFVCHRCDTPSCVNPGHLFLGTHRDNMLDAVRKGRMHNGPISEEVRLRLRHARAAMPRTTHCKHGHELSGGNVITKSDGHRQCRECRDLYSKGWGRLRPPRRVAAMRRLPPLSHV